MGGALLKGWLNAGTIDPAGSAIFDPAPNEDIRRRAAEAGMRLNPDITPDYDVIVMAVKSQVAGDVLPNYALLAKDAVAISVMAGKSIAGISAALDGAPRVARAMPNLPAAIGKGVTGVFAPTAIDEQGRARIDALMRAAGEVVWVEDENGINVVTAISGSGPAYFFLFAEALAEAGEALGLDKAAAAALARATFSGAGALVEADRRALCELRKAVTSPGGTTEAALNVLGGDGKPLRELIKQAAAAAARRAGQLTD